MLGIGWAAHHLGWPQRSARVTALSEVPMTDPVTLAEMDAILTSDRAALATAL